MSNEAKPGLANGADVTIAEETWRVTLEGGLRVDVRVTHHRTRDEGHPWCAAWAQWPGIPYRVNFSGNTEARAVNRLVAACINNGADEEAIPVVEILAPGVASRADLVAEVRRLREIIEGRIVCPTAAEIAAHQVAGGSWEVRGYDDGTRRYWPRDRDGRPCAWPVLP